MSNDLSFLTNTFSAENRNALPSRIKGAVEREGYEIVKKTMVANIHEQGRAILAKTALQNLGALSALEAHLIEVAPNGQERYRQVIDAYAIGAAQKIWKW